MSAKKDIKSKRKQGMNWSDLFNVDTVYAVLSK